DGLITSIIRFEERRATVEAAAERAGRAGAIEYAVIAPSLLTDDIDRDAMQMSHFVVRVAQTEGVAMFEQAGVRVTPPEHERGASGDLGHPASIADAMASAARYVTPEAASWYVRNCTVSGTPDDVRASLDRLAGRGID